MKTFDKRFVPIIDRGLLDATDAIDRGSALLHHIKHFADDIYCSLPASDENDENEDARNITAIVFMLEQLSYELDRAQKLITTVREKEPVRNVA